jgi:hypothetical protein
MYWMGGESNVAIKCIWCRKVLSNRFVNGFVRVRFFWEDGGYCVVRGKKGVFVK